MDSAAEFCVSATFGSADAEAIKLIATATDIVSLGNAVRTSGSNINDSRARSIQSKSRRKVRLISFKFSLTGQGPLMDQNHAVDLADVPSPFAAYEIGDTDTYSPFTEANRAIVVWPVTQELRASLSTRWLSRNGQTRSPQVGHRRFAVASLRNAIRSSSARVVVRPPNFSTAWPETAKPHF